MDECVLCGEDCACTGRLHRRISVLAAERDEARAVAKHYRLRYREELFSQRKGAWLEHDCEQEGEHPWLATTE